MSSQADQASSLRSPSSVVGDHSAVRHGHRLRDLQAATNPSAHAGRLAPPLLAIASGKGGVGKTLLAINLALALRSLGRLPLLVDLDWGLANIDVALGLAPRHHVGHVMAEECSLEEALIEHDGVLILPNGCGQADLASVGEADRTALLEGVLSARPDRDIVIVDTHPGIGPIPVDVLRRANLSIIISSPEPTALTDTYALFKVLGDDTMCGPAGLVINQAGTTDQAYEAAQHLDSVARRFLGRGIAYWGHVLQDPAVPRSVRQQRALLSSAPRAGAAHSIRQIASTIAALLEGEGRPLTAALATPAGGRP